MLLSLSIGEWVIVDMLPLIRILLLLLLLLAWVPTIVVVRILWLLLLLFEGILRLLMVLLLTTVVVVRRVIIPSWLWIHGCYLASLRAIRCILASLYSNTSLHETNCWKGQRLLK